METLGTSIPNLIRILSAANVRLLFYRIVWSKLSSNSHIEYFFIFFKWKILLNLILLHKSCGSHSVFIVCSVHVKQMKALISVTTQYKTTVFRNFSYSEFSSSVIASRLILCYLFKIVGTKSVYVFYGNRIYFGL